MPSPRGGSSQKYRVDLNEVLESMIVGAVGLPVAEGRTIYISDRFIDGEPDLWFELPSGTRRLDATIGSAKTIRVY
jgi:hypothetical protein